MPGWVQTGRPVARCREQRLAVGEEGRGLGAEAITPPTPAGRGQSKLGVKLRQVVALRAIEGPLRKVMSDAVRGAEAPLRQHRWHVCPRRSGRAEVQRDHRDAPRLGDRRAARDHQHAAHDHVGIAARFDQHPPVVLQEWPFRLLEPAEERPHPPVRQHASGPLGVEQLLRVERERAKRESGRASHPLAVGR